MTRNACAILLTLLVVGCNGNNSSASNTASGNAPVEAGNTPAPVQSGAVNDLKVEVLKPGTGKAIKSGDIALVYYYGMLTNGTEFDSNMSKDFKPTDGKEPFSLTVGVGQVIKGWDEGLVGLKEGSEDKISIPWAKAYGADGSGEKIPPKADLIFFVKIAKVYPAGEAPQIEATDIKKGEGTAVTMKSTITFKYKGLTLGGHVFDDQSKQAITQPVAKLIPGFGDALVGMKPGGKRKISWPPGNANPTGLIPANQPAEFEVEIISVK